MFEHVHVDSEDGVVVVRIDRPPANALAPKLLAEGVELIGTLRSDPPGAVVLTGTGDFFSGGMDLKLAPTLSEDEQRGIVSGINRLMYEWYGFPRPLVAAVNVPAVAGGLILALCADRRIASTAGNYGLTELRVGVPYPAAAMGVVLAELDSRAARRLVLDAELLDGEALLGYGAFDELAAPEEGLERSLAVARELAALPSTAYETVKGQLRRGALEEMRAAVARDPMSEEWLGEETPEAARAALDRD
jgi:enoyl-CoA hydratase